MQRTLQLGIVMMTLCGIAASASAGQGNRRSKLNYLQNAIQSQTEQSQNQQPSWKKIATTFSSSDNNGEKKKKKHPQLDPGRPDGRVETPDVVTMPPSRPGYVFVNGHWEREKAPSTIRPSWNAPVGTTGTVTDNAQPTISTPPSRPGYVFVNGHWERIKATSTIRPWKVPGVTSGAANLNMNGNNTATLHTATIQLHPGRPDGRVETPDTATLVTPTGPGYTRPGYVFVNGHWERAKGYGAGVNVVPSNGTVIDHRTDGPLNTPRDPNAMSGGVKVTPTITTESLVGQTVYGTGPGLQTLWDILPPYGFTAAPARHDENGVYDHRTPTK